MNVKRVKKGSSFKFVEGTDKRNQAVMYEGRILGFIWFNQKKDIQCLRDGSWLTGPRWEIRHKDGTNILHYPATREGTGKWLLAYEKSKGV